MDMKVKVILEPFLHDLGHACGLLACDSGGVAAVKENHFNHFFLLVFRFFDLKVQRSSGHGLLGRSIFMVCCGWSVCVNRGDGSYSCRVDVPR